MTSASRSSREALAPLSGTWPPQAIEQFQAFESAVEEKRFDDMARATTFLRNVLAPVPAFRESLAAVRTPAELIAEPFDRFLALVPPTVQPSPPNPRSAYMAEAAAHVAASALLQLFPTIEEAPILFAADATSSDWPASWIRRATPCRVSFVEPVLRPTRSSRSTGITISAPTS